MLDPSESLLLRVFLGRECTGGCPVIRDPGLFRVCGKVGDIVFTEDETFWVGLGGLDAELVFDGEVT